MNSRGYLTVGELKKLLKDVSDDMIVVQSGSDHSYYALGPEDVGVCEAEYLKKEDYFGEYYDDESMISGAVKIEVFVV